MSRHLLPHKTDHGLVGQSVGTLCLHPAQQGRAS